jgi:hypothetical protein
MAVTLNASSTAGFVTTADTSTILQLQTNGTTAVTVDDSQRVAFVAGTAALPAITTTGDTNTGIFFPAADTIAFAEGGAEAMRLDSSGNLLVGTTTAKTALTVNGGGVTGLNSSAFAWQHYQQASSSYTATSIQSVISGASAYLTFSTNGNWTNGNASEAARIDSSGNLLVGTTSGSNKLTIQASTGSAALASLYNTSNASGDQCLALSLGSNANNTSSYFFVCQTPSIANRLFIYGNGNVVNSNNSYGALSDVKLKENIVDASPKLANLMQVKVRNYNLIGEENKHIGVVAQELETVFPSMIDISPDIDADGNDLGTTTKSVKYSVFVPMLIKAIQEQQAIIESLKARLDAANL